MNERLLIIDDEESMRFFLEKTLARAGYQVESAPDGARGLEKLCATPGFDAALVDLKMPGMDGMTLLEKVRKRDLSAALVMMTAYGDIKTAVQALKLGAADFITKPFDGDEIGIVLDQVLARRRIEAENRRLRSLLYERTSFGALVGKAKAMRALYEAITRVAPGDVSVLILGESGTGKELVARELHRHSARADAPFVAVNASALPETLLESELFGYLPGAFTGATTRKRGLIEQADGGTLFLDEIGDLPRSLQPKLLRVLEDGLVLPLGATETIAVDFRLITATNQDLEDLVANKRFRSDLYFRLNVVPLLLPPLRERVEDIPLLAEYFFAKHAPAAERAAAPRLNAGALRVLCGYSWPGNVREMENLVERLVHLCDRQEIDAEDLPASIRGDAPEILGAPDPGQCPPSYREALARFDRQYLDLLLRHTQGNVSKASELADISRPNLHRRIRESGLDATRYRRRE